MVSSSPRSIVGNRAHGNLGVCLSEEGPFSSGFLWVVLSPCLATDAGVACPDAEEGEGDLRLAFFGYSVWLHHGYYSVGLRLDIM